MATPIAHKGAVAGAKVQALTLLDLFLDDDIVEEAWTYFNEVQTAETTYTPFITADDKPAIWLNADIMERWKPELEKYYYDPTRFDYLPGAVGHRIPHPERSRERPGFAGRGPGPAERSGQLPVGDGSGRTEAGTPFVPRASVRRPRSKHYGGDSNEDRTREMTDLLPGTSSCRGPRSVALVAGWAVGSSSALGRPGAPTPFASPVTFWTRKREIPCRVQCWPCPGRARDT